MTKPSLIEINQTHYAKDCQSWEGNRNRVSKQWHCSTLHNGDWCPSWARMPTRGQDFKSPWGESGRVSEPQPSKQLFMFNSRGNRILTRKHRKTSSLDKFHKIWGWLKLVNSQVTGVHPGLTDTSLTAVQYSANILWTLILTCSRVRWVRFYLQNNEKSSERPQLTLWRSQSYQIWSGRSTDLVS